MKTFKFRLFLTAIVVAIAFSFAANIPDPNALVTYHYNSSSTELEEMQDIDNWDGVDLSCPTEGDIPCSFEYSDNFQEYLLTFETEQELIGAATTKRNP